MTEATHSNFDSKKLRHPKDPAEEKAQQMLLEPAVDPQVVLDHVKKLKKTLLFAIARRLIEHCLKSPSCPLSAEQRLKLAHQRSICTYKDPDLPPAQRLDDALRILDEADPLATTINQETLGQAGAIYKRKWELGNHKQYLERSLAYYRRGYVQYEAIGWSQDHGYTAINAAYLLDRLAVLESAEATKAGTSSEIATQRYNEAERIRNEIAAKLPDLAQTNETLYSDWWFLVTIGEALFGLGRYEDALDWLKRGNALEDVPIWERESTARQLSSLLHLRRDRGVESTKRADIAEKALTDFLGTHAAESVLRGKIGLALSGGGFRASLYHIGVLARLAELDVLRHVEVISCVSGGSIIGAHYYLEVKKLLESTRQDDIGPQHYIDIVKKIEKDFLAGVQTNIRTSVVTSLAKICKMIFSAKYSRTNRLGELYEERLFSRIDGIKQRYMDELFIHPVDEDEQFVPKHQNWQRSAKVPILILNATTLNSGHNWQFTASWMGEPPTGIDYEVDANIRLRRLYYEEAPDSFKRIRLGDAVAASSCVPGAFEPIVMAELYPDITVRLVDGGVYDNQGSAGLLDQHCNVVLVSDASGQMSTERQPDPGMFSVLMRSKSILEERVRIAQYHELDTRLRSGLLQNLMFIHLKKELSVQPVDWEGCLQKTPETDNGPITTYGINKKYQEALSAIRTDLDSFTNKEAHALMLSGYNMAKMYFPASLSAAGDIPQDDWVFLGLKDALEQETVDPDLYKQLEVSSKMAFKVWLLLWPLKLLACVLGVGLGYLCYIFWPVKLICITVGSILMFVIAVIVNKLLGPTVWRLFNYRKTLKEIGLGLALLLIGWIAAWLHLLIFDKLYLKQGR